MKRWYWLWISMAYFILPNMPARGFSDRTIDSDTDLPSNTVINPTGYAQVGNSFTLFPVGINVGKRNIIQGILVRGQEDGLQAINFQHWLIPYDAIIQALKLEITPLPDGQLQVSSPGLVTIINPEQLDKDPELGLVFSIADLQTLFGVSAEFDINEYAIVLNPPWLGQTGGTWASNTEIPVQLEGLPRLSPSNFTLTAIEQRVNATGSEAPSGLANTSSQSYQGELAAVGTILNGSWYLRVNQSDLLNSSTWRLAEAQYLQQTDAVDYAIGDQPTFWRSQNSGNYWGMTIIRRQGFTPSPPFVGSGGFNPGQRLQASQIGRTIVGEAEPGTLVRLTQGFSDRILAEVLVDSSRIYRFEDVPIAGQFFGNYRILLYPQGRLSAQPEIRDATFSTVPGQIPAGASATIISAGFQRQSTGQNLNFLGEFKDFRGGIAQRWGVSEELTLGVGGVYDQTARGLAELFFRPSDFPLEVAASVLSPNSDGIWDVNANLSYRPNSDISLQLNRDRFSQRLHLDWRLFPGLSLLGTYNNQEGAAVGFQTAFNRRGWFTFARATLYQQKDQQNRLRWNLTQRLGVVEFTQQGNEIGTSTQLYYSLSGRSFLDTGHSLIINYQTRNLNQTNHLAILGWRYRSQARTVDGNYLWETSLGYGFGDQGSGLIATWQIAAIPGLLLRGRYEGVSLTSGQANYNIELVYSLNLQPRIYPGDRQADQFRTRGGLLIQPFYDLNHNGNRDKGEDFYTETANLLLILNNQPIPSYQPQVKTDRILLYLPPGTYRLDLDPAGFPPDWQTAIDAYAVQVVTGSYTPVSLPLIPAYTLAGVVTDATGNAIAGARVEAVRLDRVIRRFSVTNSAGVYYLERLTQGKFTLQINSQPAQTPTIQFDQSSPPLQELNLQLPE